MHNLLIVDDDEIMRIGIERNIAWEDHGVRVVGTAHNGQECLEMIPNCLPDIILTDIRMPFMDGIQLTEAVYRLYPQIKVVLLTAYGDFKYAQMALNYKVCQYVMKYEDNSEVLKAVLKAAEEYDKQKGREEMLRRSRDLLLNKYFYDMVVDCGPDEEMEERAARLGIRFFGKRFCALCANISQSVPSGSEIVLWQEKQLCEKAGAAFKRLLTGEERLLCYFTGDVHLNMLLNFREDYQINPEKLIVQVKNAVEIVEKELNITISIGIGTFYEGFQQVSKSYTEAVQALEFKNIIDSEEKEKGKIVFFEQIKSSSVSHMAVLRQIISFMDSHYQEESLSLNRIADEVHLTPSYISTLFKKYQGINIIDYLIDIRIKKAMELLINTAMKTYEISERIGYSNPQYFSVVFKRVTGMSPIEYRRRHQAEEI